MTGWIALYRKFLKHPLWRQKRVYSPAEAWLWLLINAAWEKCVVVLHTGHKVELEKGEVAGTLQGWADEWAWNKPKVKRFIKQLESDKMIDTKNSNNKYSKVLILNFESYQTPQDKVTQSATQCATQRNQDTATTYEDSRPSARPSERPSEKVTRRPTQSATQCATQCNQGTATTYEDSRPSARPSERHADRPSYLHYTNNKQNHPPQTPTPDDEKNCPNPTTNTPLSNGVGGEVFIKNYLKEFDSVGKRFSVERIMSETARMNGTGILFLACLAEVVNESGITHPISLAKTRAKNGSVRNSTLAKVEVLAGLSSSGVGVGRKAIPSNGAKCSACGGVVIHKYAPGSGATVVKCDACGKVW